jgi:hypothetical protein
VSGTILIALSNPPTLSPNTDKNREGTEPTVVGDKELVGKQRDRKQYFHQQKQQNSEQHKNSEQQNNGQ